MVTPADISGLVAWYQATPAYCFSDAAGTVPCASGDLIQVWKDRYGTNHLSQATASLRPSFLRRGREQSILSNALLLLESSTPWFTSVPATIAGWMCPTANSGFATLGSVGQSGSTNNSLRVYTAGTNVTAQVSNNTGSLATATVNASNILGVWSHVAGVFASNTSRTAYHNGGPGTEETTSITPTAGSINLSRVLHRISSGNSLIGRMSEVAIWNRALTTAEIMSLYTSGVPTLVASDGKSC